MSLICDYVPVLKSGTSLNRTRLVDLSGSMISMAPTVPEIKQLDSLLQDSLQPGEQVVKHESRMLTAPGENFGSVMLSVDVTVRKGGATRLLHLVAKTCPPNELLCKMFNIQESFQKEVTMYKHVIPCLRDFQQQSGVDDNVSELFAKFYGARINLDERRSDRVDGDAVLLLENVRKLGYDVGDRLVGFDADHVALILQDLAHFHAVPVALRTLQPDTFDSVVLPCLKELRVWEGIEGPDLDLFISTITDVLREDPVCSPHLDTVVRSIRHSMNCEYRDSRGTGPFATIAHTDYWVNNTMILKDRLGRPLKNKIVDLQMVIYHSPVYDLLFFLFTSVQPAVLHADLGRFIELYHDAFVATLQRFGMDVAAFSRPAFDAELKRYAFYELGHILVMLRPILTERGRIKDMSDLDLDLMYRESTTHPDYSERLVQCVRSFVENGWI